jgi:hypothetical protein
MTHYTVIWFTCGANKETIMITTILCIGAFLAGVYLGPYGNEMVKAGVAKVKGWF